MTLFSQIPEFAACVGFDQKNPHHDYDVMGHILRVFYHVRKTNDMILMTAALFHDIGKPFSCQETEVGRTFHNHAKVGAEITADILNRFDIDDDFKRKVVELVKYHDVFISEVTAKSAARLTKKIGADQVKRLLLLREADIIGQSKKGTAEKLAKLEEIKKFF